MTRFKVSAYAPFANAARLNHHYDDAEEALSNAAKLLNEETLDPFLAGRYLDIEASLRIDQRRLDEALRLLDQLHRHYLELGEAHLAGRAFISKGIALRHSERPQEAVEVLRQGLSLINPEREPKLIATGQQLLLNSLVDARCFSEAGELLMKSGLQRELEGEPINLLKLRWISGKIFAGLGKLQRAEEILSEVRQKFVVLDREYLAAMVDLELAAVLLRRGKAAEVEAVAEEALQIFEDLRVDREALRAVRYLRDACRQREASAGLVQEVVSFLNRLENQPDLRFRA
jgi:tetratricopeptide (TPR) repeat protein